jgi:hypothetical protein
MGALDMFIKVPSWAYDFCYYYLAVAALIAVYSIWALVKLFTLPGMIKKFVPTTTMAIALVLSGGFSVLLTMMQFWVCRSALAPTAVGKEKFAVACKSEGDCTAVNGVPQRDTCTCGARGLCGGCTMQNNMEPSPALEGYY